MRDYVVSINDRPPVPIARVPTPLLRGILQHGSEDGGLNGGIRTEDLLERVRIELLIRGLGLHEREAL